MSNPIKVAICIPSGDDCKTSFALSLAEMMRHTSARSDNGELEFYARIANVRSSNLAANRNYLVEKALEHGEQYVLFIDSDMSFPPETLARLLLAAVQFNLDIVAVTASSRQQGCVSRNNAMRIEGGTYRPIPTMQMEAIYEVDTVGTGIMLIGTHVFRKLDKPWFMFTWDEAKQRLDGEDASFCKKARAAGFKICVDFDLSKAIGHIGSFTYTVNEAADIACVREVSPRNQESHAISHQELQQLRGDTESPRVLRRLQTLREWSHEQDKPFFPRSPRTRGAHGAGAPWRIPLAVGGD